MSVVITVGWRASAARNVSSPLPASWTSNPARSRAQRSMSRMSVSSSEMSTERRGAVVVTASPLSAVSDPLGSAGSLWVSVGRLPSLSPHGVLLLGSRSPLLLAGGARAALRTRRCGEHVVHQLHGEPDHRRRVSDDEQERNRREEAGGAPSDLVQSPRDADGTRSEHRSVDVVGWGAAAQLVNERSRIVVVHRRNDIQARLLLVLQR